MKLSELPIHHAVLITHGDRATYADSLWEEMRRLSPAHKYYNQTVLDIDTARAVISYAQSPYEGEKFVLLSFHTASLPAQNAMLKILEEPKSRVRFYLITTHKANLIDTVLSRVRHVPLTKETSDATHVSLEFLRASCQTRMKLPSIVTLLTKEDEEGRKDREAVKQFILSLVDALYASGIDARYISETIECASYASDPSASGKALIEYLALLLPKIK